MAPIFTLTKCLITHFNEGTEDDSKQNQEVIAYLHLTFTPSNTAHNKNTKDQELGKETQKFVSFDHLTGQWVRLLCSTELRGYY